MKTLKIKYYFLIGLTMASFVFSSLDIYAITYYVSSSGNDGNSGIRENQPWQSLGKVNRFAFRPGDKILFKRGDEWKGSIKINASGKASNPITYSAYGIGANPIISGFTTLTSWTDNGGGIYYATLDVPRLNIVTLDGEVVGMGRYPDSGYLNYESHSGNTSIIDNQLTGTPNWTGAEIGIRKYRWIIDRHTVTNHSGSTLTYSAVGDYGNNTAYSPVDGNGYFFQNDIKCLNDLGDWCYDATANRIYMYFGGSPSGYMVKAGNATYNVTFNNKSYITFKDIEFEGANIHGIYIPGGCHYIQFNNCDFTNQGGNALYALSSDYVTITNGSITNTLNTGVMFENADNNITIDGLVLTNIGNIPGANRSGDGGGNGIFVVGNGNIVKNSKVFNSGYNAIAFNGDSAIVENNIVDSFCTVKDDGGGIYTYSGVGSTIQNNIVLNAIGAYEGCEAYYYEAYGKAAGIYLDNGVANNNAMVSGNTVAHGEWAGIFVHAVGGDTIDGNTVFNHAYQLGFSSATGEIRNCVFENNKFIAKSATQSAMYAQSWNTDDYPSDFGTFDYNYYARPIDDTDVIKRSTDGWNTFVYYTVPEWQSYSSDDANSNKSPVHILNENEIKFEYNASNAAKSISLNYPMIDVKGTKYSSKITLQPYTSVVLMKDPYPAD